MNKNFLIIIAVIIVLVAGYLFLSNRSATAPSTSTTPTEVMEKDTIEIPAQETVMDKNVVTYTDDGFSPKSITVKAGTEVTFKNESDNSMWVASAPHPAHTDLPGFDQLTSVEKGEKYSFTFEETGTWKYHNHVNPSDFGSVVAE